MNACYDPKEAIKRMEKKGTDSVSWKLKSMTVEWKWVLSKYARNNDGSISGDESGKMVLQQMVWRHGSSPYYSIWHSYSKECVENAKN
jgi:enterochelin esterase-like enzyme